jgi:hypothetical protein
MIKLSMQLVVNRITAVIVIMNPDILFFKQALIHIGFGRGTGIVATCCKLWGDVKKFL